MIRISLLLSLVLPLASPSAVVAESKHCMAAPELDAALVDWYGERALPNQPKDDTVVWVSPRTGTWSLVRYRLDGNACVIAAGDDWDDARQQPQIVAALHD